MENAQPVSPGDSGRDRVSRRDVLGSLGWTGLTALLVAWIPGLFRFLRPLPGRRGRARVDVGAAQDYAGKVVATHWVSRHGLWIVHRDRRLFALEARCTHLGCTPRWEPDLGVFQCPCHGSRFTPEGDVVNGPATRPLPRFALSVEHGQLLVDRSRRATMERAERDERFWVPI